MYSQTVDAPKVIEAGLIATDHAIMAYGEDSLKSATWKSGIGAREAIFMLSTMLREMTPEEITESAERKAKGEPYKFQFCGLPADIQHPRSFPPNRLELIYKDQPIATIDITGCY